MSESTAFPIPNVPLSLYPQHQTVPSVLIAQDRWKPALIFATPDSPDTGTDPFDPATASRQEIMATFLADDLVDGEILQIGAAMPVGVAWMSPSAAATAAVIGGIYAFKSGLDQRADVIGVGKL